jgi:hypothetical protein
MLIQLTAVFERFACIEYALLIASECVKEVFIVVFNCLDPLPEFLKILTAILVGMLFETRSSAA